MRRSVPKRGSLDWPGSPIDLAPLAFFDLETTGLRPDRGARITELAVVTSSQVLFQWHSTANAGNSFSDQLPLLLEALSGRVVVGHRLQFDFTFVAYEARRHGLALPRLQFVDTLGLARTILGPGQDFRLEALLRRFGMLPDAPLHQALVDARAARALFGALVEEGGLRTLADAGAKPLAWTAP